MRYRIFPGYGWAFLYGGWERSFSRIFRQRIKRGTTVYDIGANYGMHTLLYSRLVGPDGHVFAFEPSPTVFSALKENVELNSLRNVTLVQKAVASNSTEAFFDVGGSCATGHLTDSSTDGLKVKVTSLDEFVFDDDQLPPNFIKIDVEGAESSVLSGAIRVLEAYEPTLVVELHNPNEDRAVGALLKQLGYAAFRVTDGSVVKDMTSGWPDPNGIWGAVYCLSTSET